MTDKKHTELLAFMDRVPPALCRAMSVDCGKGKKPTLRPNEDIVKASGLNLRTICRLNYAKSWKNIRVDVASKFIQGCGFNILNNGDVTRFLKLKAAQDFSHLAPFQRKLLFSAMEWPDETK